MKLSLFSLALTSAFCSLSQAAYPAASTTMGPKPHRLEDLCNNPDTDTRYVAFQIITESSDPELRVGGTEDTTLAANALSNKATSYAEPTVIQGVTEETRRKLRHEFGFSFLVYRDKIQAELGLTSDQKAALESYLRQIAPAGIAFLQSNNQQGADFEVYRSKAIEGLDSKLKLTLTEPQRKRLGELVRQREGLFGGPSLWTGLQITDEEKSQFMAIIEPMHKKMIAVAAEAQRSTNPTEFHHEVLGLRADLERQLEAVLTDSQRNGWHEMLGKPIAIDALFDLSSG